MRRESDDSPYREVDSATMRSERTRGSSRGRRIAARVFASLIALDLGILLGLWLHGPVLIEAGMLSLARKLPNPLFVLPGLVIVWLALSWRNWRSWLGLRPDHALRWRGVPLSAWLVVPLSVAVLVAQTRDLPEHVIDAVYKVRRSANKGPAGMSLSSSSKHVAPLVRRLVRREPFDPVVVWIEDRDRRGHTAAYYLYPRLMLMEPGSRRFSLKNAMAPRDRADPYFRLGPPPSMQRSREFAEQRGAEFIVAGRHGIRPRKQ